MMADDELAEPAADIKANGLREPLVIARVEDETVLVDGRNRRAAGRYRLKRALNPASIRTPPGLAVMLQPAAATRTKIRASVRARMVVFRFPIAYRSARRTRSCPVAVKKPLGGGKRHLSGKGRPVAFRVDGRRRSGAR